MEDRYDLIGLTFSELMEVRVALDLQVDRMEHLMETTTRDETEAMRAAREYWRQRTVMARHVMELCDATQPRRA